ncbi:uncharacterized protein LOC128787467 [Vidua chalybeata]|uniref:uncharacterized protein LOC128787467 n=1 Tax=Vidua chalybeata TaxID=81927 RepID=UPI0023A8BDF8|nr:uncharacterized protein LOC128787467 [Vidua chalybeata]
MLSSFMDAFIPLCSVLNAQIQNVPKPLLSELGFGGTAKRSERPEQVTCLMCQITWEQDMMHPVCHRALGRLSGCSISQPAVKASFPRMFACWELLDSCSEKLMRQATVRYFSRPQSALECPAWAPRLLFGASACRYFWALLLPRSGAGWPRFAVGAREKTKVGKTSKSVRVAAGCFNGCKRRNGEATARSQPRVEESGKGTREGAG